MWDVDLSDTDLDLLDKDIFSKHFVCLQDVFSVTISRLPRRLQDVLEDEKLLRWGRFEDVFKTSKCLLGFLEKCLLKICSKFYTPMRRCDFNKVVLQRYWNHTLAWVLSRKFSERLWFRTRLIGCFCSCIFSEHLLLRKHLDGYFSWLNDTMCSFQNDISFGAN